MNFLEIHQDQASSSIIVSSRLNVDIDVKRTNQFVRTEKLRHLIGSEGSSPGDVSLGSHQRNGRIRLKLRKKKFSAAGSPIPRAARSSTSPSTSQSMREGQSRVSSASPTTISNQIQHHDLGVIASLFSFD